MLRAGANAAAGGTSAGVATNATPLSLTTSAGATANPGATMECGVAQSSEFGGEGSGVGTLVVSGGGGSTPGDNAPWSTNGDGVSSLWGLDQCHLGVRRRMSRALDR